MHGHCLSGLGPRPGGCCSAIILNPVSSLTDEMIPPEDIEKLAQDVLNIQLPQSPDQIQSMINEINDLLLNATQFKDDLMNLEQDAKIAEDLLQEAEKLKSVSETECKLKCEQ